MITLKIADKTLAVRLVVRVAGRSRRLAPSMSEIIGAIRPFCVAVDYDDTFSTCPATWTKVIEVLRAAGANVFCVTFRPPTMEVYDFPGVVFYTSGQLKADHMHALKQDVHVWIDDRPELIGENPERRIFRTMRYLAGT